MTRTMSDIRTREDALDAVERLARAFAVHEPVVEFTTRTQTSRAYREQRVTGRNRLRLSLTDSDGLGMAVYHEFAHHLTYCRFPQTRVYHESAFCEALRDVIEQDDVDPTTYPWHKEYECVYRWAKVRGLTSQPSKREERRQALYQIAARTPAINVNDEVTFFHGGVEKVGRVFRVPGVTKRVVVNVGGSIWRVPRQLLTRR